MGPVAIVGNFNIDYIIGTISDMPRWGTEWMVEKAYARTAGAAGNTALALGNLGQPCVGVGNVGTDAYGSMILADLQACGVDTSSIEPLPGASTGIGFTIVRHDGERTFLTYMGSLQHYDDAALRQAADTVSAASVVLLTGWNLMPRVSQEARMELFGECRRRNQITLLDTGWDVTDWAGDAKDRVREALPLVDLFLPNAEEARALTGLSDPREAGQALLDYGARAVIVKLGPEGSLYLDREHYIREGGERVDAVDTAGAGDVFNAGVIFGLTHAFTPRDMLRIGNRVAAHVVARTSERYPSLDQVWP
jgi:ribokinase/argininosuccinate lyase